MLSQEAFNVLTQRVLSKVSDEYAKNSQTARESSEGELENDVGLEIRQALAKVAVKWALHTLVEYENLRAEYEDDVEADET